MKKKIKIITLAFLGLLVSACGVKEIDTTKGELDSVKFEETEEVTNYVKITMENNDMIIMELYPDIAPITVDNFQKLVSEKYYDGTIFHRVIENFMIQGGDGKETATIKGEFGANGFTNLLEHTRGVVSMARTEVMDSASSQFFIVHKDAPHLNGRYAAFGKVIAGMNVVDNIAETATDSNDKPIKTQKMKNVRFVKVELPETKVE